MSRRLLNLLATLLVLLVAAAAMAAQEDRRTCVMFVLGVDAASHQIIYVNAIPFADAESCRLALTASTLRSDRAVLFYSVCFSPTDQVA